MNRKEKEIQKALGTLPVKEFVKDYAKLQGVLFIDDWWYFPLNGHNPSDTKLTEENHKSVEIIGDVKYFKIADSYIDDFLYSMTHAHGRYFLCRGQKLAGEVIKLIYVCIAAEGIDH